MKKFLTIANIVFQIFLTYAILFAIYIIFALLDNDDPDIPNAIGFLIFQPLYGIFLSTITIIICFIAGLPIRLINKVYNWWSDKPYIIIAGLVIGIVFLILSLNPNYTKTTKVLVDGLEKAKQIPNLKFVLLGWFIIAFSTLHFYPLVIFKWFKDKITAKTSNKVVSQVT